MKKFKFTIKGNQYDVDILNIEDNTAEVQVNGNTYTVEVDKTIQQSKTPLTSARNYSSKTPYQEQSCMLFNRSST